MLKCRPVFAMGPAAGIYFDPRQYALSNYEKAAPQRRFLGYLNSLSASENTNGEVNRMTKKQNDSKQLCREELPRSDKKAAMQAEEPQSPGITQPHNTKKESLGPNTKR